MSDALVLDAPVSATPPSPRPVPYGFATERLVVRCYEPADAEKLLSTLQRSREHLVPWLPWAGEVPDSLDLMLDRVRRFRGWFDCGTDFVMGIFSREDGALVGGTGLHTRIGPDAREIGYWIAAGQTGQGLAQETCRGLVRLGFEHLNLARIEIRVNPSNLPSRRIPEQLGFHLDGTLRKQGSPGVGPSDRPQATDPGGPRPDSEVWSLLPEEFAARLGDFPPITAWDAATRPLPGRAN